MLECFVFYLASLSITLAFNQSLRSDFEWLHRVAIVAGAIWVGAWLVSTDLHHQALRLLLAATTLMATLALVAGASSGFAIPAQPLGYQKNFVGSITGSFSCSCSRPIASSNSRQARSNSAACCSLGALLPHTHAGRWSQQSSAFSCGSSGDPGKRRPDYGGSRLSLQSRSVSSPRFPYATS